MAIARRSECWYCGRPTTGGRACPAHRDLERLDPYAIADRPPADERELGIRPTADELERELRELEP